jgi:hypothetical protein
MEFEITGIVADAIVRFVSSGTPFLLEPSLKKCAKCGQ